MSHAPARDVQQGLVYAFERDRVEPYSLAVMSREEIADLVLRACRVSGTTAPAIRFDGDRPDPCYADLRAWALHIKDWGRNPTTVLHEVAHLAAAEREDGRQELRAGQAHGPVFLRVAIDLYASFTNLRRIDLERAALGYGLRFSPAPQAISIVPGDDFYEGEI